MAVTEAYSKFSNGATGARNLSGGSDTLFVDGTTISGYVGIEPTCRAVYVSTGGNMQVTMADGSNVTFVAIPDGTVLPIQARRVHSTSTTASNIIALF
tara:strand:- start:509 stop:802 length:294 start_codon:yes stop_codon:yes gene_type:complete